MTQQPASDRLAWIGNDSVAQPLTDTGVVMCGACTAQRRCRLGVQRERLDGEVALFDLHCPRDHEGGPNVAHGGWTASVMDEMLGHVPLLHRQMTVTATLTVNFVKPVPVERRLRARAWVDRVEGSKWFASGELLLPPSDAVLATATGIWVARDPSHFARHEKWLAEQGSVPTDSAGDAG